MVGRREVITGLGAAAVGITAAGLPRRARAADKLVVIGHAVHQTAATKGPGGDVTEDWRKAQGTDVEWLTFSVEATNERAFREASLAAGNADICFILDRYTGPQFAGLFEDLNEWQQKDPIPDFAEVPAGMLNAHSFAGKLTAIPFRHATHGLLYNKALYAERGIAGPPKTIDELVKLAETLTFTRPDGNKVYGHVINLDDPATPMDWLRAHGGDFITADYKVVVDQPGAVRGMTVLRDLYRKGVFPKTIMNLKTEDVTTFMQQGRAAMTNNPFGRYVNYNDPKASKFPGQFEAVSLPLGVDGHPIPAKTSVWAMAIPKNGRRKALAWSLIKHLSTRESTVREALNGNGPVRPSAYDDPRVQKVIPYAAGERAALETARLVVPGFENSAKAMDLFIEALGTVLLGTKEPQVAMTDLRAQVEPLLPR